jgi:hypothetical protein
MCEHMMVTWNVQGCSLTINDGWDVAIREKPNRIVLTEAKHANATLGRLGVNLDMKPYMSRSARGTKGGVITLASHRLGKPTYVRTPPRFKGYAHNSLSCKSITRGFGLFVYMSPPGQKDRALRKATIRYVDSRVRIAGEQGELVAVGGDFNPTTSNYSGCSETGGVCVPVPVTPSGNTWIANGSRPRWNDFWLTYSTYTILMEGGVPQDPELESPVRSARRQLRLEGWMQRPPPNVYECLARQGYAECRAQNCATVS